jgi:GNAT superfamily N-acetyltransferase
MDHSLSRQLMHTWALDAAAFAGVLAELDPSWNSETCELAGGRLVLSGAGLYVNRAIEAGIEPALDDGDIDVLIERSAMVGVKAAIEVSPATHRMSIERLRARGFAPNPDSAISVLTRGTGTPSVDHPDDVVVRAVVSDDDLDQWMEVSALGWGHATPEARQASDVFARAAHVIDGDGMVIAFTADGRPLGCASLTIRGPIATLGGMSTIPAERGRGVQAALIHHRLGVARSHGCAIAASSAVSGGASQRNLIRHGFAPLCAINTWTWHHAV